MNGLFSKIASFLPSFGLFQIVSHLLKKPQARVIVLFTRAEDAR